MEQQIQAQQIQPLFLLQLNVGGTPEYSIYSETSVPLPLRGMNMQGIPEMKRLQEWCLIMMKILSFNLMACSVILSAHSAKNCSLGKLQPLKAFGDFKRGRMIFLSFFSLWQGWKYSTSSQGWEERGVGQKPLEVVLLGAFPGESTASESTVMLFQCLCVKLVQTHSLTL